MILDMGTSPDTWDLLEIDIDCELNSYDAAALQEWAATRAEEPVEAQTQEGAPEEVPDQENAQELAEPEPTHD